MYIVPVAENTNKYARQFIAQNECFCVQLAYYVRKQSAGLFFITSQEEVTLQSIRGVIYIKSTLFYYIPYYTSEIEQVLKTFLQDKKLSCIHGTFPVSQNLKNLLIQSNKIQEKEICQNHYNLMLLKTLPKNPPEKLYNDDAIVRCTLDNLESLYDLQYKYLEQEVVPKNKKLTDLECRMTLTQILKNQIVLALISDGEIVSKANTNAIGINCVQIGGVFTAPLFRRNYYAWHLLYMLCQKILKNNKSPVLFVKSKNEAALNLYKKIGFEQIGEFEIIYL